MSNTKQRLMPCHPARARILQRRAKAKRLRMYPFTLVCTERETGEVQPVQLKLDPGSKTTGVAIVADFKRGKTVVWACEIQHRGQIIHKALLSRKAVRRNRRNRKTRYRKPGLPNNKRQEGWLAPSLLHRVLTTITWVKKLCRFVPVTGISIELVRYDMQLMQNPEISGVEYQQGTLAGYELREYLLEKWHRRCAYCDAENLPLQIEHITAKINGGTGRASNLALACEPCNQAKGKIDVRVFLAGQPDRLRKILAQAKAPLRDAAAMNSTRKALYERLKETGLSVETGTGWQTKFNRIIQNYPKTHWIDAACVGFSGENIRLKPDMKPLLIKAMGHGNRQMCGTDKYGFPIRHRSQNKYFAGFQSGDMIRAVVPTGKYAGTHVGRITVRQRASFRLNGFDVNPKHIRRLQGSDGYAYTE